MKRYKLKEDTPAFKAGTECYIEEAGNMVPCRGISYTIVHKDQLEKNPNILTDWFEEIKESTRWKPKMDQEYYCLGSNSSVIPDDWCDLDIDRNRFETGNCFQTEEEAEKVVEYLKALAVVRGDATKKFVKGERNWFVFYNVTADYLDFGYDYSDIRNGVFGLPLFATEEDAQRSIEQHKDEWLTIFGIKEEDEAQK